MQWGVGFFDLVNLSANLGALVRRKDDWLQIRWGTTMRVKLIGH